MSFARPRVRYLQGFTRHSAVGVNAPRIFGIQMTDLFSAADPELPIRLSRATLGTGHRRPADQQDLDSRRRSDLITPVPKPKKRRRLPRRPASVCIPETGSRRTSRSIIRRRSLTRWRFVEDWRNLPNPDQWMVTPETARLLQHWRHHQFRACAVISQASLIDWNWMLKRSASLISATTPVWA